MFKYLGEATQTTASVIVRGTTNGAATLTCNGVTYNATIDTTVKDGMVRFDVTGLSAGTSYSYSTTTQDETATGTLRTQSSGIARLGFFSCGGWHNCLYATGEYDLDALVAIGDEQYYEGAVNNLSDATTTSVYNGACNSVRSTPTFNYAINRTPFYVAHDDHEYAVNDINWTLAKFQTAMAYVSDTTDMQAVVDAGAESTEIYSIGNPANSDSGIDAGAFYFRLNLGNHAEVFVLSQCVWGRDPTAADRLVRGASGSLLGPKQLAWFKARLKASTKKIKIVLSPKMTLNSQYKNPDGFFNYLAEFTDDIAPFIHAGTDWVVPGGVIWGCGDYHTPSVHSASTAGGDAYDHVAVTACPSSKDNDGVRDSGTPGANTVRSVDTGQGNSGAADKDVATDTFPRLRNFGVMEVAADGSYVEAKIVLQDGSIWWKGRVNAGSNALSYPTTGMSI